MMDAVYSVARPTITEIRAMEIAEFYGVLDRVPSLEMQTIARALKL